VMLNYRSVSNNKKKKLQEISFETDENEKLKTELMKLNNLSDSDKEIVNNLMLNNKSLIEKVNKNTNLKVILDKKNYQQIEEVLEDLINDFDEFKNKKRIESLEKKLINNMEESAYAELIKLKSQLNRE